MYFLNYHIYSIYKGVLIGELRKITISTLDMINLRERIDNKLEELYKVSKKKRTKNENK